MTCGERWPFSSWATVSAAITADCFCSGGYLAIAWSIFLSESTLNTPSPVDLAENYVLGPDDRHHVSEHMPLRHLVERRQMGKARRADLHAVGLVRAVGDDVNAEFPFRVLDCGVGLARRDVDALGEEQHGGADPPCCSSFRRVRAEPPCGCR